MPDDLAAQMPILHQLLSLMNVTVVEKAGVEADDIIGTLSRSHDGQSFILSGDRDMFQLVSDRVTVLFTKRGVTDVESVTPTTLKENYGLTPSQVVEYKALRGDTSDNIPGVKGIGEKTAMSLLQKYGDIDELYRNLDSEKGALHEKLAQDKDMAFVSRQLARIVTDADVDCDLSHCGVYTLGEEVRQFLEKLQFRSLISRLQFEDKPQAVTVQTEKITTLAALREAVQSLLQAERTAFYYDGNVYLCGEAQKDYEVVVGDSFLDELTLSSVAECIAPLLQSDRPKAVYDVKAQRHLLSQWGTINGVKYDVCLMQYLVEYRAYKDVASLANAYGYASYGAALWNLSFVLDKQLAENGVDRLYYEVELPLSDLLYRMENEGVAVDMPLLGKMSQIGRAHV